MKCWAIHLSIIHIFSVTEDFGQPVGAIQDKREWAGEIMLHELELIITHFGILADTA